MTGLLLIPHTAWSVPQRMHDFVPFWANVTDVHVTNWDGAFGTVSDVLSWRYASNLIPRVRTTATATVHHIPRVTPAPSRWLRDVNESIYQRTIRRIVRRQAADVVVGSFVTSPPPRVPKVLDICDDHVGHWRDRGGFAQYEHEIREREQAWMKQSESIIVVSSVLADRITTQVGSRRVFVIPNGVDASGLQPDKIAARKDLGLDPDAIYVGNIGSLDRRNEAERLLAVGIRLTARPDAVLLVVGGGSQMLWLQREIARAGLRNVSFVGFATGDSLKRYFQSIDVGLCPYRLAPSFHASVPLRLLRYSAAGAGVVCTRLKEVERMGFGNVVFSDDDHEAFADTVLQAVDRTYARPHGLAQYDQDLLAQRFMEVLMHAAA